MADPASITVPNQDQDITGEHEREEEESSFLRLEKLYNLVRSKGICYLESLRLSNEYVSTDHSTYPVRKKMGYKGSIPPEHKRVVGTLVDLKRDPEKFRLSQDPEQKWIGVASQGIYRGAVKGRVYGIHPFVAPADMAASGKRTPEEEVEREYESRSIMLQARREPKIIEFGYEHWLKGSDFENRIPIEQREEQRKILLQVPEDEKWEIQTCRFQSLDQSGNFTVGRSMYKLLTPLSEPRVVGNKDQTNYYSMLVTRGYPGCLQEDMGTFMSFQTPNRFPGIPLLGHLLSTHEGEGYTVHFDQWGWQIHGIHNRKTRAVDSTQILPKTVATPIDQGGRYRSLKVAGWRQVLETHRGVRSDLEKDPDDREEVILEHLKDTNRVIGLKHVVQGPSIDLIDKLEYLVMAYSYYMYLSPIIPALRYRGKKIDLLSIESVPWSHLEWMDYASRNNSLLLISFLERMGETVNDDWHLNLGAYAISIQREAAWRRVAHDDYFVDPFNARPCMAEIDTIDNTTAIETALCVGSLYPKDIVHTMFPWVSLIFRSRMFTIPGVVVSRGDRNTVLIEEDEDSDNDSQYLVTDQVEVPTPWKRVVITLDGRIDLVPVSIQGRIGVGYESSRYSRAVFQGEWGKHVWDIWKDGRFCFRIMMESTAHLGRVVISPQESKE